MIVICFALNLCMPGAVLNPKPLSLHLSFSISLSLFLRKLKALNKEEKTNAGLQVPFDPKIGHFIGPIFFKNKVKLGKFRNI